MYPTHDNNRPHSEADRTSQTRFGPRPVPTGHHGPKPSQPSRRIIASGRLSPDGKSAYPSPSTGAKIAVWGGIALGVAGGTAAAIFAVRKIAEAISDDPRSSYRTRPAAAYRPAKLHHDDASSRHTAGYRDHDNRQNFASAAGTAAQHRTPAKSRKHSTGNFVEDVIQTSNRLSKSLEDVASSFATALTAFRGVSQQATGIVSEFAATADQLRAALKGQNPSGSGEHGAEHGERDRTHRI